MTKLDSHHSHNLSEEVVTETVRRLLPSLYVHSPEWRPRRQWELEGLRPLRGRCSRRHQLGGGHHAVGGVLPGVRRRHPPLVVVHLL